MARELIDRPKADSLRPLVALWGFMRPYLPIFGLALVALLIASGALLALPVALRRVVDAGVASRDLATIDRYFLGLAVVAVLFGLFSAIRFYIVMWLGERIVADIRDALFRHVLALDPAFFEVTRTGEVLSRLTTDTSLVQSIATVGISISLRTMVMLIGGLVMLIVTSPSLTGFILLGIPLVVVPIVVIGRRLRRLSHATQDRIADTSGLADETLNAMQTVQAYTLEDHQFAQYSAAVQAAFRTAIRRTRVRAALTAWGIVASFGAITFVLWLGTHAVIAGTMSAGELTQFLMYAVFVGGGSAGASEIWGELQRAAGAMERITELLATRPAITAPPDPEPLPLPARGSIAFDDIGFSYPSRPGTRALDAFSLRIEPGETVALVGPSGAGKSTVFQLLLRFYEPQQGRILVDGIDLTRADPKAIRERIGLVPQDTVIFGASAAENIRLGRPGASDAEVRAAASAAAADDFIERLPEGYATFLGERGLRISTGQRQRIAIARAILKDPPILLLDEATSALDAESERLVQQALEHLTQGRTTLVIAHRLATVLQADRIVVLDQGRIVDVGTHAELMQRNELYAQLARLQFIDPASSTRIDYTSAP